MSSRWIVPGIGLAATLVAARWLPASPDAGLRATLVVAPLVAALVETLQRQVSGRRAGGDLLLLAAAWAVVALHAGEIGLAGAGRPLFAAFLLLVAARLAGLLPALYRRTAKGGTRALAAAAFVVGLAALPWVHAVAAPDGDEPYFLLLTESLTRDGDFDLRNQYASAVAREIAGRDLGPQPGDPVGRGGEVYSRHQSALPFLLAPGWWLAGMLGARLTVLLVWSLASERLYRVAVAFGASRRGAFRTWLFATFSAPFALYAQAFWTEIFATLAVAVVLERWAKPRSETEPWTPGDGVAVVAALVALPLLKIRFAVLAAPLAALLLARRGVSWRLRLGAVATVFAAAGALLSRSWLVTGRPLRIYDFRSFLTDDLPQWAIVPRLFAHFLDGTFGLFAVGPIWLLALSGCVALLRRRRDAWMPFAGAMPYLVLVSTIGDWYGAWGPPFRLPFALLPLGAAALAPALERPPRGAGRWLRPALAWASFGIALLLVVEPGWTRSLADGRGRLVDLVAAPFAADFARFLPSFVRWRTATLWASLVAVAVAVLVKAGRSRARRADVTAGAALVLAAFAVWITAARRVPTTVAEAEDPWLEHRGGALFPPLWQPSRAQFTGAWWLGDGAAVAVAPVPGGPRATVALRLRPAIGSRTAMTMTVRLDDTVLATIPVPRQGAWRVERVGPVEWTGGGRLVVSLATDSGRDDAAIELDRVEFEWR